MTLTSLTFGCLGCALLVISFAGVGTRDSLTKEVASFKSWTRVTPEPVPMGRHLDWLCRSLTKEESKLVQQDPHAGKYIHVYVNGVGEKAMLAKKAIPFPVGSIIVKEKLSDKTSKRAELLTVMVKRKKGADPGNGDWQYYVFDAPGKAITESKKVDHCQDCHRDVKNADYVFGNYLGDKRRTD